MVRHRQAQPGPSSTPLYPMQKARMTTLYRRRLPLAIGKSVTPPAHKRQEALRSCSTGTADTGACFTCCFKAAKADHSRQLLSLGREGCPLGTRIAT